MHFARTRLAFSEYGRLATTDAIVTCTSRVMCSCFPEDHTALLVCVAELENMETNVSSFQGLTMHTCSKDKH